MRKGYVPLQDPLVAAARSCLGSHSF